MAGSFIPQQVDLGNVFAALQARVNNMETTPNAGNQTIQSGALTTTSGNGWPQSLTGQYQWPYAPYAGVTIYGVVIFDGAGNPLVVMGEQPDGTYGLCLYDGSGSKVVSLGQQATISGFGLAIKNQSGVLQQVGGTQYVIGNNTLAQSGTFASPTNLNTSVTFNVGPSHQALITWGSGISTSSGNCNVELQLDNTRITATGAALTAQIGWGGGAGNATISRSFLLDCGSSGSHTVRLMSWDTGGLAFDVLKPIIVVNPL